tara:strand:- start:567 stop:1079 length:513 start_codon:yes stop_codon:yes gene_type:complete
MIEINTYYSEKYKAYGKLLLNIIYLLFPIILICLLIKYNLIPKNLGQFIISIIVGISGFYIIFDIIKISHRDNMNFSAYDWQYDVKNINNIAESNFSAEINKEINFGHCIDALCCDKETQIYDELKTKCVTKSQESFIPQRGGREENIINGTNIESSNIYSGEYSNINNE